MVKIFIVALLATFTIDVKADMCDLPSCNGNAHIDCLLPDGAWGEACPEEKNMLNLAAVTNQIIGRHNDYRNRIAGGSVPGFESSKRMGLVAWNITLANFCRKNVRQCDVLHDGCRNTPEYDFTGQNLGYKKYPVHDTTPNINSILEIIDLWYGEIANATMDDMREFSGETELGQISHATQMLKGYATRVGCAASATTEGEWRTIFVCCNYDIGNILGWPVYDEGPAASACKTGRDAQYKNLCSANEVFNINNFWEDYM